MNSELCEGLLDILCSCKESAISAYNAWELDNKEECVDILHSINETVMSMYVVAKNNFVEDSRIKLRDACKCILVSIAGIYKLIDMDSAEVAWKLQCELISIIETTYLQFLYWAFVVDNPELKDAFCEEVSSAYMYNNIHDDIDLTILLTAYNHLDVTIGAVESILREIPKDINVELVLHNHGSTDDTLAYFNSIENAHVFNVAVNFAVPQACVGAVRGRFWLSVSNDVVVGTNAIKNMYKAINEGDSIGWIVPTTPNISNLQPIQLNYNDLDGFLAATSANNKYDVRRHEKRVRLCNPLDMSRSRIMLQFFKDMYVEFVCAANVMSFPDDKLSAWMRRNGYKIILQKDAYCHHIGSVTVGEEVAKAQYDFYNEGRKEFYGIFGVDPWGKGFCYDKFFYGSIIPKYEGEDKLFILGVNCGLGSNSLKVRETLKENGSDNLTLVNITDEEKYLPDLKGISDEAYFAESITEYIAKHSVEQIDYLVVEEYAGDIDYLLNEIKSLEVLVKRVFFKDTSAEWIIRRLDEVDDIA